MLLDPAEQGVRSASALVEGRISTAVRSRSLVIADKSFAHVTFDLDAVATGSPDLESPLLASMTSHRDDSEAYADGLAPRTGTSVNAQARVNLDAR